MVVSATPLNRWDQARAFFVERKCAHAGAVYVELAGGLDNFRKHVIHSFAEEDQLIVAFCMATIANDDGYYKDLGGLYQALGKEGAIAHLLQRAEALQNQGRPQLSAVYGLGAHKIASAYAGLSAKVRLRAMNVAIDTLTLASRFSPALELLDERPALLRDADKAAANFVEHAMEHAAVWLLANRPDKALEAYAVALHYASLSENNVISTADIYLKRGQAAMKNHSFPLAVANLEESYSQSAPNTGTRALAALHLSQVLRAQGRYAQAHRFASESVTYRRLDYHFNPTPGRLLILDESLEELALVEKKLTLQDDELSDDASGYSNP
jgi:tetratricopeptide (TPR) repeat protein